ncbi:MAG: peptidyl-prolyl cis-trans isomerase [Candidatus Sumerlaeia bacterium]|nr:peptidyl-prolyl cis-trans isomerase [Candidatus Sumerlaeia bacterium]
MKFPLTSHIAPLLFALAISPLAASVPDIKPATFDLEALYSRIVPFPSTVPNDCRQAEVEVTPARQMAFEARLAGLLEEEYGPINNDGLLANFGELDERAHALAFRFTLEDSVTLTEEEIQETYEEHLDRFQVAGRAMVDFFFVEQKEGEEDTAPEFLLSLREKGTEGTPTADLRQLAREAEGEVLYSENPIRMVPTGVSELVWEIVSTTPPGEFSPVSRTNHGWHLFLVHEVRQPGVRPLEEVESTVRGHLLQERALALRDELRKDFPDPPEFLNDREYAPLERRYIRELYGDRIGEIKALRDVMINNARVLAYEGVIRNSLELTDEMRRAKFEENPEAFLTPIIEDVLEVQVSFAENEEQEAAIADWYGQVSSGTHPFPGVALLEELGLTHRVVDYGPSRRGPRGARLDMTVRDMEVNTISDLVDGSGYHRIFYLRDRVDRRPMTFEEAREDIDRHLLGSLMQEAFLKLSCQAWEEVTSR